MNWLSKLLKTYNDGLKYPQLEEEHYELAKTLTVERQQFTNCITDLENEIVLLHADLLECSETNIEPIVDTFNLKTTLSNLKKKIESTPFKYPFMGNGIDVDIKKSLYVKDQEIVDTFVKLIQVKYKPTTPLECVEAVSRYFIYEKKPIYVREEGDLWEPADVFLYSWRGDCDTTAITMHVLIKNLLDVTGNSEHYDRLYIQVNRNYKERHLNNLWLHDDGYFYTVESTMDAKGTFKRKWLKVPLANDSFYTKCDAIANINGSHMGSNAIWDCFL